MAPAQHPSIWGLLAEFERPPDAIAAARRAYEAGYRRMDAYSPYPIEELCEAIGFHRTRLPLIVLIGGILGGLAGYGLQYWTAVVDYPINVGGRPLNSWPQFVPITFELTILCAAGAAVLGMLALNGLPRPHHPVFGVESFARASRDRFFLCIESSDARFDPVETRRFLEAQGATVSEVHDED